MPESALAAEFFDSELYSDVTVKFSDRAVKAHRNYLHTQSDWFKNLLTGDYRDSKEPVIELREDNPDAVYAMLHYFYKRYYDIPPDTNIDSFFTTLPLFHAQVYIVADKYMAPALRSYALDQFKSVAKFETTDDGAWNAYEKTAELIYDTGLLATDPLRKAFVDVSVNQRSFLTHHEDQWRALADDWPALAQDLSMAMLKGAHLVQ